VLRENKGVRESNDTLKGNLRNGNIKRRLLVKG